METYCQNPLCENEATREVAVSVNQPSDETRALCAVCEEAYTWGVQHGQMAHARRTVWVGAVTDHGDAVHAVVVARKVQAVKGLAEYLRTEEGYVGPAELPGMCDWLAAHEERLGVEIFCASLDAAGNDSDRGDVPGDSHARKGLVIEPPPKEDGPEQLYRIVYAIDVNAEDRQQAAKRAYEMMKDPESLPPVLEVLDDRGRCVRVDLSAESPKPR